MPIPSLIGFDDGHQDGDASWGEAGRLKKLNEIKTLAEEDVGTREGKITLILIGD